VCEYLVIHKMLSSYKILSKTTLSKLQMKNILVKAKKLSAILRFIMFTQNVKL